MIRIISDSSSLYSEKKGQEKNITIASLTVHINGKSYREYEDIETEEFINIIKDLINNETVQQMKNYRQHFNSSCFDQCLEVAYWSYLICKKLGLDYVSAARAGMLHDLFLYDWRNSKKKLNLEHFHAFIHPKIALENATKITTKKRKTLF